MAVAPGELEALRACVHCGICLPQCPTYRVLGEEMDSPRGRLYLMRAVVEGRLQMTATVARHLDLCLGCRACETACPSGVQYGFLLEAARARLHGRPPRGRRSVLARLVLGVVPRPARVEALLAVARGYQRSGLQPLVRALGLRDRLPRLAAMEALLPRVPAPVTLPAHLPAQGPWRGRVGLLTGCVQRTLYGDVNLATARLLALAGWEVVIPRGQGCCGALDLHAGRLETFRAHARALAAAFPADLDHVITNAAGCGSAMKGYGHWLGDAPEVLALAARTRDVSELLAAAELPLGPLDLTVTYHDACHLAHGQRIRVEPRTLLGRIPGLRLVELGDSDVCCGSAGVYNLLEPAMAERLLEAKVERIRQTGARVVAAGNPGCLLQIAKGCRERGVEIEVVHPVELLARAAGVGGSARS